MHRIYSYLAFAAVLCLVVAFAIGYSLQFAGDIRDPLAQSAQQWKRVHFLFGLVTAIVVALVNSIAITYFIGTSRWVREVVTTYRLAPDLVQRSARLKRRAFPWALGVILMMLALTALGATADPVVAMRPPSANLSWRVIHFSAAIVALLYTLAASVAIWNRLAAHHRLIQEVLAEVQRIRAEKGLD